MNSRLAALAIVVFACQKPLLTQQRVSIDAALHTSDRPYIQSTGHASLEAKPDQAFITIGVVTQAPAASAAAAENVKQTDSVLGELRKLLGGGDHLKTTNYSVRPVYQTPKPGSTPVIAGYIATNLVEVTVDDLAQVGRVVDTATQSGANNIQNLELRLKNTQPVRSQVLRDAAAQAKADAEAIATGLGVHVLRVLSAEEATPEEGIGVYNKSALPRPAAAGVPTPVEIGTIEVEATVTLRLEVAP